MAKEYVSVLKYLDIPFIVIGRGEISAKKLTAETGEKVITGGIDKFISSGPQKPDAAIIAVSVEELSSTTLSVVKYGVRKILVEKPLCLFKNELELIAKACLENASKVFIAYNRRFFNSTKLTRQIIEEDGGVTSFSFEFTEWSHIIEPLKKNPTVKERWALANSSHVMDLAFHLCGKPSEMCCMHSGSLKWHQNASRFSGAGKAGDTLFSYSADWDAPGRWGIEVMTAKRRIVMRPIETVQIQEKGKIALIPTECKDQYEEKFKPGLMRQIEAFISSDEKFLCHLDEYTNNFDIFCKIAGYKP